jgi:rubrerythrin
MSDMEKYGVDEQKDEEQEKKATDVKKCPVCGADVGLHGNVRVCPNCGTAPYERKGSE